MAKITKETAEHYKWGQGCDGWKFLDQDDLSVIVEKIPPHSEEKLHFHKYSKQIFYILKGVATIKVNHDIFILKEQESIIVAPYCIHNIRNDIENQDLEFLLISYPKSHGDRTDVDYS